MQLGEKELSDPVGFKTKEYTQTLIRISRTATRRHARFS